MGNKVRRPKDGIFIPPRASTSSISLTIPSMCTSPSFHLSVQHSASTASDIFNWQHMQNIHFKQEHLRAGNLTPPVLKVVAAGLETLKRDIGEICWELQVGTLKMPDVVVERFGTLGFSFKGSEEAVCSPGVKKLMTHFVKVLYIHDLILIHFRENEIQAALDLLKQTAVHHAIFGVLTVEFRMINFFIAHYLIKNKLIHEENINYLIMYLSIVCNYIEMFYESQSVRFNIMDAKHDDRENKARENFRLMKKWKKLVAAFRDQDRHVDQLLTEQMQIRKKTEETTSIDTITLKKNDFIMKHFIKN